ncbi:unnamed protein product [Closterium sp. Naga37s-1]|nr:unnamed protein product [Closterium sp. Naga37s-1]
MLLFRPRSYVARIPLLSPHPPASSFRLLAEETSTCPVRASDSVERVQTATGVVQVTVCGDRGNPPLITYHDVGLNHSTCFQGLMLCADTSALLLRNFCIFHVDAPGHEEDAEEIPSSQPLLRADDLAEQVAEVARHFALADVTLMGVTAGAYVLTLFALSHRHLVRGLILVSPLLSPPSWSEWAHNKVTMSVLSYYGMTSYIKDSLFDRYFCPATAGFHGPASDALMSFRRELDYLEPENLMRYFYAIQRRRNLLPLLAALQVPVLLAVGDSSPFNPQARSAFHHLHAQTSAAFYENPLLAPGASVCSSSTASPSPSPSSSPSPSPSHSHSDFLSEEEEGGLEHSEEVGGRDARGRRSKGGSAAVAECDRVGGGRRCDGELRRGQTGTEGAVTLAVDGEGDGGREERRAGIEEREWEEGSASEKGRESEEESRRCAREGASSNSRCESEEFSISSSRCESEGGSSSRSVVWVEVEACGSLVTEERPHTLLPALCHFISQLCPAVSHPWDSCQRAEIGACAPWEGGSAEGTEQGGWEGQESEQQGQQEWQRQEQWAKLVNAQQQEQQDEQAAVRLSSTRLRSHRNSAFCIPFFQPTSSQQQQQEQQDQQQQSHAHTSRVSHLSCTLLSPTLSHPLKSPFVSGSHLPSPSSFPTLISPSSSSPSTSTPSLCTPFWTPACTPAALSPTFTPAAVSPVCIPAPALSHPPMANHSSSSGSRSMSAAVGPVVPQPLATAAVAKGFGQQACARECGGHIPVWQRREDVLVRQQQQEQQREREWEREREREWEREREREQMLLEVERRKLQPVRTSGETRRWEEEQEAQGMGFEQVCGSPTS